MSNVTTTQTEKDTAQRLVRRRRVSGDRPTENELRQMVEDAGLTDDEIADLYKVSRQAVSKWRGRYGMDKGRRPRFEAKDHLPWRLETGDSQDPIATQLRYYYRMKITGDVTERERSEAEQLVSGLAERDYVITYDIEHGFGTTRRDPKIDDPDDIVRRPDAKRRRSRTPK